MKLLPIRTASCLLASTLLGTLTANAIDLYEESFIGNPGDAVPMPTLPESTGISSGGLSYAGLDSSGNKWGLTNNSGSSYLQTSSTALAAGETVFFSFLFRVDDIGGLGTGGTAAIFSISPNSTQSNGVAGLGFGHNSSTDAANEFHMSYDGDFRGYGRPADVGYMTETFVEGETIMIVGSYTRAAGTNVNFWINPDSSTFGLASAPVASYSASGNTGRAVNGFIMNSNGSGSTPETWFMDEIRIGNTWADVTPVPEPSTVALIAAGCAGLVAIRRRRS